MNIDDEWLETLETMPDLASRDSLTVEGVELTLPVSSSRKDPPRTWKRRVIPDIVPDYPLADAPEKMLYRILHRLTDPQQTERTLHNALEDEYESLIPLYEAKTLKKEVPVAFHVLAVNSVRKRMRYRVFKEKTFLLMCRDQEGILDDDLVRSFVERFRRPPQDVELSQAVVIEQLQPEWNPDHEFATNLESFLTGRRPFLSKGASLFRRDLCTLMRVETPHSQFFQLTNQLLSLHFGLYQNRLAKVLNPAIEQLIDVVSKPESCDVEELEKLEAGSHPVHRFNGDYAIRCPEFRGKRRLALNAPARQSYVRAKRELTNLHFSILMFNRIREATKCYLREARHIEDEEALREMVRWPSQIADRVCAEDSFRKYLMRAFEAMACRFIEQEIAEESKAEARQLVLEQDNGLEAMYVLYQFEARESAAARNKNRAVRSGIQVLNALLGKSDTGIISSRRGVGKYFELGATSIPLLLLLIVGEHEKVQLDTFWEGLGEYGLRFEREDRELLLARLKMMGLYERFSDAGEANYVRSLMNVR